MMSRVATSSLSSSRCFSTNCWIQQQQHLRRLSPIRILLFYLIFCVLHASFAFPSRYTTSGPRQQSNNFISRTTDRLLSRNLSSSSSTGDTTFTKSKTKSLSSSSTSSIQQNPLRGGGEETPRITPQKELIQQFLRSRGSSSTALDRFHIQGWRWHTKSMIREVGRLQKLASKTNLQNTNDLQEATNYVIGFNLKGLHKIEADLFFPWMRQQLTTSYTNNNKELSVAFGSVMDELEKDRQRIAQYGRTITQNAAIANDTSNAPSARTGAIQAVADQSAKLEECARSMMEIEDTLLVPAVAALVPEREQKSFNNKVLGGLGLWDSRLHLVSMYEAVQVDKDSLKENALFRKAIPSVPQMMIPRWKRKLYAPKTYMLE